MKRIKGDTGRIWGIVLLFALLGLSLSSLLGFAATVPEGPMNLTVVNTSRKPAAPATQLEASAGNISQLNIIGNGVTQTWQGYYGNITGTISLEDSSNFTLYNWVLSNPEGEIYASNNTIDFSYGNIECYNFTREGDGYFDLSTFELGLGVGDDDVDGVNETFSYGTNYGGFYAGTNLINGQCPETQLFNASGEKSPNQFNEVLLYENTSKSVIYTALIQEGFAAGFNNQFWNFEMIVGVNGHNGSITSTTYYFYVELE